MSTADKKAYPLRISEPVLAAMQRWAADDLRSLNAQIEYVLREALIRNGRLRVQPPTAADEHQPAAGDGESGTSG